MMAIGMCEGLAGLELTAEHAVQGSIDFGADIVAVLEQLLGRLGHGLETALLLRTIAASVADLATVSARPLAYLDGSMGTF